MNAESDVMRRKRLTDLRRKASLQASIHSMLADRHESSFIILRYTTLFFSAALLALTFVSDDFVTRTLGLLPDSFKWLRVIASVVNFYAGLVLLVWKPSDVAGRHRAAVAHYADIQYVARSLEEREGEIDETALNNLRTRYLDTSGLPHISDRVFLSMKRKHLVKVSVSQYLDQHPHAWIWWIRLQLWRRDMGSKAVVTKAPGDGGSTTAA